MKNVNFFLTHVLCLLMITSIAQKRGTGTTNVDPISADLFANWTLRNLGPGFMSGRISDIAIDPTNENIWYVAVSSGGVWKTVNAGTTFQPIFDKQSVYSIGCVTIDPSNPHIVWVGTGENDGGRHISFGDGVYKSEDGGTTWKNMGLKKSEHVSKIIVHPENSNVIMVASQGPLWTKGGERGFYKSVDGGKTWKRTLGDDEWIGVTELLMDPRDPNRLYAATWERHRTVAALMDGGEKTRLHASSDGGETWEQLKSGLPEGKWGKIGLALSPQQPDVLYAAIELNRRTGGVWRSENRGGSWTKMSNTVAGATGPHYYQEIYCSPHKHDRLYMMNNQLLKSEDGGKTFLPMDETAKHGDNHSITFKASDPNYLLVGSDGGVYESFDLGATWRFMENIPVTQFYKVAVDDAAPFYNIYGGTQDNSTQGGPSRTDNISGIRNADWKVVLNWDGHQPATEPGNPNIIYGERQQGNLSRIDMITGEATDIQPQAGEGEPHERFNWDAPILVSPHSPTTIFFASYRVWMSENRGDTWKAISGDLTKNQNRLDLPIMGNKQSWDSPWDVLAMSNYNTITSLAESPKKKGLIYAGTDDGLLQVTENGGQSWRKIEVAQMGVPATSFINDVKADLFDENTVYVSLDNHKYGDYKPYIVKSTDKGATWTTIVNGLGDTNMVWRVVQDHVNKDLLFAGAEFGLYFSVDGGRSWTQMKGGVPTISFRDLAIQRRENDLVAASFGRGFYVLDDYSALRNVSKSQLEKEAALFVPRKAYWYVPRSIIDFDEIRGSQGSQLYLAPNPDFGANFTYYLKDEYKSAEKVRQEKEKKMKGDVSFPGWDAVEDEAREMAPAVFLEIKDKTGKVVNRVEGPNKKGMNRVAWNLRVASPNALSLDGKGGNANGLMVAPGTYTAQLYKVVKGEVSAISEAVPVEVVPLRDGALKGAGPEAVAAFWRSYEAIGAEANEFDLQFSNAKKTADKLWLAAQRSSGSAGLLQEVTGIKTKLDEIDKTWNGYASKNQIGEKNLPTVGERLFSIERGVGSSTYGPTDTHKKTMEIVRKELTTLQTQLEGVNGEISALAAKIVAAGGPKIEGQN